MKKLIVCVLLLSATGALAIKDKPRPSAKPKYKLTTLKINIITAPATAAATTVKNLPAHK
jgi:hypothetical protein